MHLTRLKDVPITQLFCVDVALVLEKMKHHQTYQFHPRQMQVKAAQDLCLCWCILHLPFIVQRKKAILIGTLKFCRKLITSLLLVLSCQETDDCRLPNITCWEEKENSALALDAITSWQYLMPLAIPLWSTAECSLHLKW